MNNKRKCFTPAVLEGIARILGDTNSGLTGPEIGHFLKDCSKELENYLYKQMMVIN